MSIYWDDDEDFKSEGDINYEVSDFIEEGDQARDTRGLFTVDPSLSAYLGRFTLKKDNKKLAKLIASHYQNKWGATNTKYIYAYEFSDKGVPHVHFISYHKKDYSSSTMSDFWRGQDIAKDSGSWHKKAKTNDDIKKYLLYTIKDNDIIYTNLSDEELQQIRCENDLIREDMSRSPLDKLLHRLKGSKFNSLKDLAHQIILIYVNEYDKAPPMAQLKGWTTYLWIKLGLGDNEISFMLDKMF